MGNSINGGVKLNEIFVYVQTNDPYYSPSSFVHGAVYLDVYSPVTIYNVELRLRGTERVKWEEVKNSSPGDNNKITEKMKDKQTIFSTTSLLQAVAETLPPGQYQYPFSFQLPDQIPGTFEIKHGDYDGRIRYTLTAVLNCADRDPIKYRTELVIRQRPTIANYNAPVTVDEEVCICCSNKGRCSMTCNFQSDTYQPGNTAILMTTVDNSICTVDIKNFTVTLKQTVDFRTRNGRSMSFSRDIRSSDFSGVASHTSTRGNPQLMSIQLEEPFESGKLIQPSVHGMMITCNYQLQVRPAFDATCACCSNTPTITVPLFIYAPELQEWVSAIPQDFHPKVYDVCNIIVPVPSIRLDFDVPGGNVPAPLPLVPGQISVQGSVPTPNINAAVHSPHMNVGVPGFSMNMQVSGQVHEMHSNVGGGGISMNVGEDMKLPSPKVHVDLSGPSADIPGAHMGIPGMRMDVSGAHMDIPGANVGVPGANAGVNVAITGPDGNFDVPGSSLTMHVGGPGAVPGGMQMNVGVPGVGFNVDGSMGNINRGFGP
eukprot:TRINITY_DN3246_c0_g1_i1.p1 TRINITY_DN3246_c0_g1~~TRINITY_DN3246_c0_g1_i1.p1  ORF type:complete len:541 (-),score=113.21 TRINITY_DN3246_c0_g1_i1:1914-3536(-)